MDKGAAQVALSTIGPLCAGLAATARIDLARSTLTDPKNVATAFRDTGAKEFPILYICVRSPATGSNVRFGSQTDDWRKVAFDQERSFSTSI